MIVITKVEMFEVNVPSNHIEINTQLEKSLYDGLATISGDLDIASEMQTIKREILYGKRYRNPAKDIDVVIAASKQAQEAIGIMYEAWETKEKEINKLRNYWHNSILREKEANEKLEAITHYSLWQRIKAVFVRY